MIVCCWCVSTEWTHFIPPLFAHGIVTILTELSWLGLDRFLVLYLFSVGPCPLHSAPFPIRYSPPIISFVTSYSEIDSSWNVMAHGDAREGKWRGNWRMEWVASTLHTTSKHGVSSINTADAHTSAASSRLNWRPCRFKWSRPFRRKTNSGFCACAITFQLASTDSVV